jgi:hypothetical protein
MECLRDFHLGIEQVGKHVADLLLEPVQPHRQPNDAEKKDPCGDEAKHRRANPLAALRLFQSTRGIELLA